MGHLNIKGLKMSKSLKNFIKIKSMVGQGPTAARQMRLFFLLHQYDVLMNYDPTTSLQETEQKEKKYVEFFLNVRSHLKSNAIENVQKLNDADKKMNETFWAKRTEIDVHLKNNFNTKGAMKCVDNLVKEVNKYILSAAPKHPIVLAVSNFVKFILNVLILVVLSQKVLRPRL